MQRLLSMCLQDPMKEKSHTYDVTHDICTNIHKKCVGLNAGSWTKLLNQETRTGILRYCFIM